MKSVEFLVAGAGVTGLAFMNALEDKGRALCIERATEPGGYCKTIRQDGFVWDYSGHFFHFRHPDIERFLVERMGENEDVRVIEKRSSILFEGHRIDFPFQKNIHQLPKTDFIECLHDLYFREQRDSYSDFLGMLYGKFGRAITEKFLRPYNEKLYACSLDTLDADAMGRFFPYADLEDVMRNMKESDNTSYNGTFTYPSGGAIQYINALLHDLDTEQIHLNVELQGVDLENKVARTTDGEYRFEHLVSALPLPRLLEIAGIEFEGELYTYNKVLVFNLGFDRKGWKEDHWVYIPDPSLRFYRVGFYDNIFDSDRMSLYVEVGLGPDESVSIEGELERVLRDLRSAGIVDEHELVSWHSVVLDPAYVHIHGSGQKDALEKRGILRSRGVHSVGRYGAWKYCSIEDNILEARELASQIGG